MAQCPFCVAVFKSPVALQAHAVYSHPAGFFTCAWCEEIIENESEIWKHAKSCPENVNREEAEFEAFCIAGSDCNICESSFPSHGRAIAHYKEIHLHCIFICGFCVKYFHKKEKLESHLADAHPEEGQASNLVATLMKKPIISERSSIDKYNLTREFNEKRCIDCKISFASIAKISEHFRTEHQFEMHVCMKCEKGYTLKHSLDKHPCRPQKLSDYSVVYKHMKMEKHENSSGCQKISAKKRIRILSDDSLSYKYRLMKEFNGKRCLECQLDFASVTEITEHFKANHFDVHICKICDGGFMSSASLWKHHRNVRCHRSNRHDLSTPVGSKAEKGSNKMIGRLVSAATSNATLNRSSVDRKHPCCLCPYDIPTYEMGLNHYAEAHDVFIFGCPAPHCFQLFRRFSKWSRHFLKSHPDVELPADSEFRTLLDDIMEQAYDRFIAESLTSVPAEKMNLLTTSPTPSQQKIHVQSANIPIKICSTPMPLNGRNRGGISSASVEPTKAEIDKKSTADSDIEIVEWIPDTGVKPIVKFEDNMDWM